MYICVLRGKIIRGFFVLSLREKIYTKQGGKISNKACVAYMRIECSIIHVYLCTEYSTCTYSKYMYNVH